ncbi:MULTISPECIES: pyridoxamine 5'-phosphate oxidase family protein [unclassified Streptomyces]|uniref:pyridoxamine 5'-phosphate oxidase family protein n=1 Tax=unclassified Streptomyces TaxID=2593676 RepID=UPI0011536F2A|nr:pyridoxamine 5'-phosphate oxidase family protein [Streptomyces sp. SLBN-31]TQJ86197.1 pyridoxamine 5'-phosphate oxidase-like protein [Streptomyces sp. SLBN-31]
MRTAPATLRMVRVSGAEALCLLERSSLGRLVYTQRDLTVLRPAAHVWADGRLFVRTSAPAAVGPVTATYDVEEIGAVPGTGWTVTVSGPAEVVTDIEDAACPTPGGRPPGPHDTVLRIRPRTVAGFRVAHREV